MDNNTKGESYFLRETFFKAEGEYIKQIQSSEAAKIRQLNKIDGNDLALVARHFIDLVEYGCIDYENMELVEKK